MACEARALCDELLAYAQAPGAGFHQEQPQPGGRVGSPHEEDRADDFAIQLSDPAALAFRIIRLDETCHDLGNQSLEALVPTIFLRVQHAVAVHHPAQVAGLVRAQDAGGLPRLAGREHAFDGVHRLQ